MCFAFATQSLNNTDITFDPTTSFVIISMVVIGGLGSIPGAILGALYLEGLPAIFGSNQTIQFITSGLGLLAFILYLPGGLAEVLHRTGDLVTLGVRSLKERYLPGPSEPLPPAPTPAPALVGEGAEHVTAGADTPPGRAGGGRAYRALRRCPCPQRCDLPGRAG